MVDTHDDAEEHSGVNPISSTAEGGASVSHEEFNVAFRHIENLHDDRG